MPPASGRPTSAPAEDGHRHRGGRRACSPLPGEQVHDATGKLVIPGGVDAHTHLHMPVGAVRVSDDFVSGTRAAAIGGTTTIIDYVTVARGDDPMTTVATWRFVGGTLGHRLGPSSDLHRGGARIGRRGRRRGGDHLLQALSRLSGPAAGGRRHDRAA